MRLLHCPGDHKSKLTEAEDLSGRQQTEVSEDLVSQGDHKSRLKEVVELSRMRLNEDVVLPGDQDVTTRL